MGTNPFPGAYGLARVSFCREAAPGVFELAIERRAEMASSESPDAPESCAAKMPKPMPGQFFMLKPAASAVFLMRPLSVFMCDSRAIRFLIQKRGAGTRELCSLRKGDWVRIAGPIGNGFALPGKGYGSRVALVGGGAGIAPIAYLASILPKRSFDLFACFRSSPYGIEAAASRAGRVFVATEDGSEGDKGMLADIFKPSDCSLVYACGPLAMLKYVKEACSKVSAKAFLSLESRMACGAGACLGCAIATRSGNRRCCVDGPVFPADELIL